jgi:hypothetical protein
MSAIQNEPVKKLLLKAENLMEQEKYKEAISFATAGLEVTLEIAKEFFSAQSSFSLSPHNLNELDSIDGISVVKKYSKTPEVSSKLKEGIKDLKGGVKHSLDRIQGLDEITICYCLGINIEQYVRYRKMAGYVVLGGTGEQVFEQSGSFGTKKHNLNKKDAEVSLNYCTKTIIDIEETLKRLNKPLSEE